MKIKTLLLFVICPFLTLNAQNWQFKVGLGWATLQPDLDPVGSWTIGAGYEWEFNQHWTFTTSLQYAGRGWELPNEQVLLKDEAGAPLLDPETGDPLYGWKNTSATAYYVELPIMLNYYHRVGERKYIVASAGPYLALGVGGKTKIKGDTDQQGANRMYYDFSTFSAPNTHRFDIGGRFALGFQFANNITTTVELSHGITQTAYNARNAALTLNFGYTFR
ncbi:MAG: PorT family protein [Bacteroidaceae bacterium]|nr:PorT family protein [Bacteroidaceae bacterium]